MSATATKPRTPKALQRKRMSVAQAAEHYRECKRAIDGLTPLLDEAKGVLLDYFERTGRAGYKDTIGWQWTGGGLILNQAKVREELGDRLPDFQTRAKRSRSLTLLK